MRKIWFSSNYTWPIRIKILEPSTAIFLYPQRRCHVEVIADFHLRIKPVMLKEIYLEIKGLEYKEISQSFRWRKRYIKLLNDVRRKEEFIYDDFSSDCEGRLFVKADGDNLCLSEWFPIKLTNKKDGLSPLKSFEGSEKAIKL